MNTSLLQFSAPKHQLANQVQTFAPLKQAPLTVPDVPHLQVFVRLRDDGDLDIDSEVMKRVTCLGPETSQKQVFEKTTQGTFQAFFRGLSVLVFSIGATGTGKTYTMIGGKPEDQTMLFYDKRHPTSMQDEISLDGENRGIIPRTFEEIFSQIEQRKEDSLQVSASFVELYMDDAFDLVNDFSVADSVYKSGRESTMSISSFKSSSSSLSQALDERQKLEIRGGTNEQGFFVAGAKEVEISNAAEGKALVRHGVQKRRKRGHKLNQESSRSHAILTIKLFEKYEENGSMKKREISRMTIADLAGNERLNETETGDEGKQESIKINKDLSAFARCIASMAKSGHPISSRDNSLTKLLVGKTVKETKVVSILTFSPQRPDTSTKDFAKNVFCISKPSQDRIKGNNTSFTSSTQSSLSYHNEELLKLNDEMLTALKTEKCERQIDELIIREQVINDMNESMNCLETVLNQESEIKMQEMQEKHNLYRKQMAREISNLKTQLRESQQKYHDLQTNADIVGRKYIEKKEEITRLQSTLKELQENNERIQKQYEHLQQQYNQVQQQNENDNLITERLKSELERQREQYTVLLEQQQQKYEKILATQTQQHDSEKKGLLDKHQSEIEDYNSKITKLQKKLKKNDEYVAQIKEKMEELEQAKAEEEKAKASSSTSFFGKVVNSFFSSSSKSEDLPEEMTEILNCTTFEEINKYKVPLLLAFCKKHGMITKGQSTKKNDLINLILQFNQEPKMVVDLTDDESNQRKRKHDLKEDERLDESPSKKNKMDDAEEVVVVKKKTTKARRKKK
ncbi:hypothetical protein C9374_004205 [Naegleria lovaniensis]|uniref:Kinesin motor domain-containing protein n=1 Tax=Naegleria lovaniensis TaxID=51637 RepID=A0AA88GM56_NAELO|nr:uncharacterized protein C9374_004205 [Naegleria lovaniensis]KAG2383534.1 hypothetical protein C9374_004205 [Naegleria lovaniensis]